MVFSWRLFRGDWVREMPAAPVVMVLLWMWFLLDFWRGMPRVLL